MSTFYKSILVGGLVLLLMVFPFSLYLYKAPLYALIFVYWIHYCISTNSFNITRSTLTFTIYYSALGTFFICWGLLLGTSVAGSLIYTFPLYVLFPLIYFPVISIAPKGLNAIKWIDYILVIGGIGCSLVASALVASSLGYEIIDPIYFDDPSFNVDLAKGQSRIKYHGISSLGFIYSYLLSTSLLSKRNQQNTAPQSIRLLVLVMVTIAILLSGRRALLLAAPLTFILALLLQISLQPSQTFYVLRKSMYILLTFLTILPGVIYVLGSEFDYSLTAVFTNLYDALTSTTADSSVAERSRQAPALLEKTANSPFIGYGHGAAASYIRSPDKPWRYELSYLDLLFHTGFVGFALYSLGGGWIIRSLTKISKDPVYSTISISLMVAFIVMLFLYSSNPYLNALDILWVVYLPVYFINIVARNSHQIC